MGQPQQPCHVSLADDVAELKNIGSRLAITITSVSTVCDKTQYDLVKVAPLGRQASVKYFHLERLVLILKLIFSVNDAATIELIF